MTALHFAADAGKVNICIRLLEKGAQIEAKAFKHQGRTPLVQAVLFKRPKVIKLLLEYGANPNVTKDNKSLLEVAVSIRHPDQASCVQLLSSIPLGFCMRGYDRAKDSIMTFLLSLQRNNIAIPKNILVHLIPRAYMQSILAQRIVAKQEIPIFLRYLIPTIWRDIPRKFRESIIRAKALAGTNEALTSLLNPDALYEIVHGK